MFGKGGQVWILWWIGSGNDNWNAVNKNSSPAQVNMGVNHVKLQFYERSAWVAVQRMKLSVFFIIIIIIIIILLIMLHWHFYI